MITPIFNKLPCVFVAIKLSSAAAKCRPVLLKSERLGSPITVFEFVVSLYHEGWKIVHPIVFFENLCIGWVIVYAALSSIDPFQRGSSREPLA